MHLDIFRIIQSFLTKSVDSAFKFLMFMRRKSHQTSRRRNDFLFSSSIFRTKSRGHTLFHSRQFRRKGTWPQKKFNIWYRKLSTGQLLKKDAEIPIGRFAILASILVRHDHPLLEQIIAGFDSLVMDATAKPE
ncbi:MAG: hypothetical protein IPP17_18455 [Bacteroidetes bacterium]|nr:hypothetical protein [Bacteroidota bacterium]